MHDTYGTAEGAYIRPYIIVLDGVDKFLRHRHHATPASIAPASAAQTGKHLD